MATRTLTITVDDETAAKAMEIAGRDQTDLASMFSRYLLHLAAIGSVVDRNTLPPKTRHALGLLKGADDRPWKEVLTDELIKKYGS